MTGRPPVLNPPGALDIPPRKANLEDPNQSICFEAIPLPLGCFGRAPEARQLST